MARTVDISEMLQKITAFNTQFLQAKREILSRENINASAINLWIRTTFSSPFLHK